MTDHINHIRRLFTAELQFRLASAVRLATTFKEQPLDVPVKWTHGEHSAGYGDLALRQDQAEYAAWSLHRSATFLLAVAIKDAIEAVVPKASEAPDPVVRSAYLIATLIRNAFTHEPFAPTWLIDRKWRSEVFEVPGIISLDTRGLNNTKFHWKQYGGPLALLRLCQFVRIKILHDDPKPRKVLPIPRAEIFQIGDLVLKKAKIPAGAKKLALGKRSDGTIALPGGYTLGPPRK